MWKFIGGLFTGIVVTIITIIILMGGVTTSDDNNDVRYFDEPIELKIENKYCEEIEIIQTNYPFCICKARAKNVYIWETYTVALKYNEKYFDDYTIYINPNKDKVMHIGNYTYTTIEEKIITVPIIEVVKK